MTVTTRKPVEGAGLQVMVTVLAQSPHRPKNGQLAERKVDAVPRLQPGTAGDTADGCSVDAEEPRDVCGRAACVQHGEHFGLLLGGELGLPPAVAALGAR